MRLKRNMYSSQGSKRGISGGKDMTAAAAVWSWADDKLFEDALVKFPDGVANRWQMIAGCLPGKTALDVMVHYETLVYDVGQIEVGLVEVPSYPELTQTARSSGIPPLPPTAAGNSKQCERKKGRPWTVKEHMLFLRGLEIYGKSDWRSISRNVVKSRLPSQVASHAQKYFNRQKSPKKDRKRSSIHDITKPSDCMPIHEQPQPQPPSTHAMDCFTAINNANAAMDCFTGFNTANAAVDCLTGINNANAGMGCYINNTTNDMDCYINNDTMSDGAEFYLNNNNNNTHMSAGMDCFFDSMSALDCLSLPECSNTANAMSVSGPANASFQTHDLFPDAPYSEMDIRFQPAPVQHM